MPTVSISPATINLGQSATVTWGGTTGNVVGGNLSGISGTQSVTPSSCGRHRYYIQVKGCEGSETVTGEAFLDVTSPAPDPWVSISPSSIYSGQNASLSWGSSTGRVVGGNVSGASGSQTLSPGPGSYSYSLRMANLCNAADTRTASASLSVSDPPPPPPPPDDDDDDDDDDDCFLAGTKVTLEDGTVKNVEDIKRGDRLLSYDVTEGKFVGSDAVVSVVRETKSYIRINGGLQVTPEHAFMANNHWENAATLKVGDVLMNANGQPVKIESLVLVTETVPVYHIEVQNPPSTYFAGGMLVHNADSGESKEGKGFVAGTKVILADGRYVPIEQLRMGDKVLSYDRDQQRYALRTVLSTGKGTVNEYLVLNKGLRMGTKNPVLIGDKNAKGKDRSGKPGKPAPKRKGKK
ncbi:MAG: hypothetical protein HY553_20030 [Elusimicrobia bacterium]|nr:hypothetical protein [Elusimicrobiota bacterium]